MAEYMNYFGQGPEEKFILSIKKSNSTITDCLFTYEKEYTKTDTTTTKYIFTAQRKEKKRFTLYYQMLMFFANGGGTCYVLSAGNYKDNQLLNKNMMSNAINALEKEREITMVVIPEAVHSPDCANIQTMVLDHCSKMQNRFAILDVQAKSSENQTMMEQVKEFQTNIGNNGLHMEQPTIRGLRQQYWEIKILQPICFLGLLTVSLISRHSFPKIPAF